MTKQSEPAPDGQFFVYQTADGKLKIAVRFEGDTVWLTQQHMAELFQTTKQNIGQHLKNVFADDGGDMDDVLDWYPPVDGGLAQALIDYEPALQRAGKLLTAIDNAIRDVCEWKPEDEKGSTDQPA